MRFCQMRGSVGLMTSSGDEKWNHKNGGAGKFPHRRLLNFLTPRRPHAAILAQKADFAPTLAGFEILNKI